MKTQLVNGEIYHVCYRAVGDTTIFKADNDYYRGIFSIYEFNNDNPVNIWERRNERAAEKRKLGQTSLTLQERDVFVEMLAFCFMPNHIHLLLRQVKDDGITKFIQKVGSGYAGYSNKKYNRKGHLFNKFKAILIQSDDQLKNVFTYIHANPISLIEPGWKENGIQNSKVVNEFLKQYKWSSYLDYIGTNNFPSLINKDFLLDVIGGNDACKELVENWVHYKGEVKNFEDVALE